MRAVTTSGFGDESVLRIGDVPDPVAGPGELLIEVVASGVNRADLLQRRGLYPPPPGASDILGLEVAGRVTALGEGVTGWAPGDACVALLSGGGYADLVAVPADQAIPPPVGVDLVTASGIIEVAATVVSNVPPDTLAGRTLLVHGGAGGIGTFAIQYGRALGARVIATAGTDAKRQLCRDLGAEVALDYHDDWVAEVLTATEGRGVDEILDVIGAAYLSRNLSALADDGRLVVIGLQGGRKADLDLGALLAKRATVTATSLRGRPAQQKARIVGQVASHVWPLFAAGQLRPPPETRFGIEDVAEAHRHLDSGHNRGKVLLVH